VSAPAERGTIAPLRLRLAALGLDVALLAALAAAITLMANAALGRMTGDVFSPFWRDPAPIAVEREPAGERELDALDDGTRVTRDWTLERRRYDDGAVRVYSVMHATLAHPDGTTEVVDVALEMGRDLGSLIRLRLTQALLILGPFAWLALWETSRLRATPGKLALGLAVVDADGRRLTLLRSLLRQAMKFLEIGGTGLGYFVGAMLGDGRSLHDRLSGTRVVRTGPAPRACPAAA